MPPIKEIHYFDSLDRSIKGSSPRFRRHLRARLRQNVAHLTAVALRRDELRARTRFEPGWDRRYFLGQRSTEWYRELFRPGSEAGRLTGEITPAYSILSRPMIEAVYQTNAGLRIIFLLRDPIDRSWSQTVKELSRDRGRTLAGIPHEELRAFLESPACTRRSSYADSITTWRSVFPEDQIFIASYDELRAAPRELLARLLAFLGLEPDQAGASVLPPGRVNAAAAVAATGMPEGIETLLAKAHLPQLRALQPLVGTMADGWIERAERVLAP